MMITAGMGTTMVVMTIMELRMLVTQKKLSGVTLQMRWEWLEMLVAILMTIVRTKLNLQQQMKTRCFWETLLLSQASNLRIQDEKSLPT